MTNREDTGRNLDGTFKPGYSGNPGGRPRNVLKEYLRGKFEEMSDEDKEEFLSKVSPELKWQMVEGRPAQGIGQDPDLDPVPALIQFVDGNDNKNTD